jgi:hypothetical protein
MFAIIATRYQEDIDDPVRVHVSYFETLADAQKEWATLDDDGREYELVCILERNMQE